MAVYVKTSLDFKKGKGRAFSSIKDKDKKEISITLYPFFSAWESEIYHITFDFGCRREKWKLSEMEIIVKVRKIALYFIVNDITAAGYKFIGKMT